MYNDKHTGENEMLQISKEMLGINVFSIGKTTSNPYIIPLLPIQLPAHNYFITLHSNILSCSSFFSPIVSTAYMYIFIISANFICFKYLSVKPYYFPVVLLHNFFRCILSVFPGICMLYIPQICVCQCVSFYVHSQCSFFYLNFSNFLLSISQHFIYIISQMYYFIITFSVQKSQVY